MTATSADPHDAAAKLKQAYRVLLTCHRNPDGDAIGSELALAELARGAVKTDDERGRATWRRYLDLTGTRSFLLGLEAHELRLRRVDPSGAVGPAITLALTGETRASGFPRLARRGEEVLAVCCHPVQTQP